MRSRFGVVAVLLLAASLLLPSQARAQDPQPEPEPELELEVLDDGGGALAITHADDVIIDDTGDTSSQLHLRDPGTTNDWRLSGGTNGDFFIYEPDGSTRLAFVDGASGDSRLVGRDDVIITASGGGADGGDVFLASAGDEGDIYLTADGDQTIVQSFGNTGSVTEVLRLQANVPPQQVFDNTTSGAEWFFAMTADDQFKISRNGTGTVEAKFFDNGNLALAGTLIQGSDANNKTGHLPVEPAAILDAVAELTITEWNYLNDTARHIGPTAQDFATAFGLGDTTTGIAAVDADGIALAAIQALTAENAQLRATNDQQNIAKPAELTPESCVALVSDPEICNRADAADRTPRTETRPVGHERGRARSIITATA